MRNTTEKLRLKPSYSLIPHSSHVVELRRGAWNPITFTLYDESEKNNLFSILCDLNGQKTIAEISEKNNIPSSEIESIIDKLRELGAIETSPTTLLDYYLEEACPAVMQRNYNTENLTQRKIVFLGENSIIDAIDRMIKLHFPAENIIHMSNHHPIFQELLDPKEDWIYDALALEKKLVEFTALENCFVILAQQHVNPIISARFNLIAKELKLPWIHGAIDGPFLLIGPLFSAAQGPCYNCFETRISMNLREHTSYLKYKQALISKNIYHDDSPIISPLVHLLASHLSLEILNYLATGTGFTRGKVLSIYLPTMEIIFNDILRVSGCHVCGSTEHRDNSQLYFDYQSLLEE